MASARARTSTCSPLVANGLAGQFVRLPVCGTSKWWYFNAVRGSISNMACGSVPPFPPWSAAQLFEFAGQSLSGQVGGATGVVPEWHALLTTCARLVRADKRRFCLCPIGPVGHLGIQECWRCYKGPMGRRSGVPSGECMGGRKFGNGRGVQAYGRPGLFKSAPRSLQAEKAKGRGTVPEPFSRGFQSYWEACQKCGASQKCGGWQIDRC